MSSTVTRLSPTLQRHRRFRNDQTTPRKVWGGEHLHVGLHSMMGAEDAELKEVPLISKSSSVSTRELFARFFPSGSSIAPDKCTIMDMGAGFG